MKQYKVVKEFGCAKKGDTIEMNDGMWGFRVVDTNTSREMWFLDDSLQTFVENGYVLPIEDITCDCCPVLDKLNKVSAFVDEKLKQYTEDYNNMMDSYNEQEIPTCVKVEAETVYYNMSKLLNAIKDLINE